jgi:hypothetical protein
MARFSDRTTRLARQRESSTFATFIMPLSTLLGLLGILGMLLVIFDYRIKNRWEAEAFAVAATAAAFPIILLLFRWLRGHFNRQLDNP